MSSDIQPGDLVVCLSTAPLNCAIATHVGNRGLIKGRVYSVQGVERRSCGCPSLILDNGHQGHLPRFRKLPPYQQRFADQLRTSLPSDERVKEPASC